MVHYKNWKIYKNEDLILQSMVNLDRWNGGRKTFKFNKKTNELKIADGGVYCINAYANASVNKKHNYCKDYSEWYRFTIEGQYYYGQKADVEHYISIHKFPDSLPEEYVDFSLEEIKEDTFEEKLVKVLRILKNTFSYGNQTEWKSISGVRLYKWYKFYNYQASFELILDDSTYELKVNNKIIPFNSIIELISELENNLPDDFLDKFILNVYAI